MNAEKTSSGISVVIPVYRSASILPRLVARLLPALRTLSEAHEVIFVVDGSPDDSWSVVRDLASRHEEVRGISMMRNYGQHNALLCGIRAARYATVVTMDDDLQHRPETIGELVDALAGGVDVVYGPPIEEQHGLWRDLASKITKAVLQGTIGAENARHASAFRVLRTHLRDAFAGVQGPYVNIDVLLTWGTTRFDFVRVPHDERAEGKSNYTLPKLVMHAFNMMTGFSALPLRLSSYIGFGSTLFGLAILAYVLINWAVRGSAVPGFAFLASIIVIFTGAQLVLLGIMGEYLARMHFRIMDKPPYVVHDRLGFEGRAADEVPAALHAGSSDVV